MLRYFKATKGPRWIYLEMAGEEETISMSRILIDIGNSNIKQCVWDGNSFGPVSRRPTSEITDFAEEIAKAELPVAIASVRQGCAEQIQEALVRHKRDRAVIVQSSVVSPVYGFYKGMGADRIADVASAFVSHGGSGKHVAVVGLGTGTAITVVSPAGEFVGGLTTLGLGPIAATLTSALPALPPIDPLNCTELKLGKNIVDALTTGTLAAHVGLVEKWVELVRQQIEGEVCIVATGGWSGRIASFTHCIQHVDPLLTLKGINVIAENSSAAR